MSLPYIFIDQWTLWHDNFLAKRRWPRLKICSADTEVEIEFYNRHGDCTTPSEYHIPQVVKIDDNGVFHFTCNLSGWWSFSALSEADYTLADPNSNPKSVEPGAVLWLYFAPIIEKKVL